MGSHFQYTYIPNLEELFSQLLPLEKSLTYMIYKYKKKNLICILISFLLYL